MAQLLPQVDNRTGLKDDQLVFFKFRKNIQIFYLVQICQFTKNMWIFQNSYNKISKKRFWNPPNFNQIIRETKSVCIYWRLPCVCGWGRDEGGGGGGSTRPNAAVRRTRTRGQTASRRFSLEKCSIRGVGKISDHMEKRKKNNIGEIFLRGQL